MAIKYIVAALAVLAAPAWGFSAGAPEGTCGTMTPKHLQFVKQATQAPYSVKLSSTAVNAGGEIQVTLAGNSAADKFKGFMLQAREGDKPIGTWTVHGDAQTLNCDGTANAVTHIQKNGGDIGSVSFTWTAPASSGKVRFYATVVKQADIFWVGIESDVVQIQ